MRFVALLSGGGVLLLFLLTGEHTYLAYRSVPREQAVAVAQAQGPETSRCGKAVRHKVDTTYRVTVPRPGYPASFTASDCPGDVHVGAHVTLARRDTRAHPEVTFDPLGSQLEVVGGAVVLGIAAAVAVVLLALLSRGLDAGWARLRRRR